jgi:hypothetical protein
MIDLYLYLKKYEVENFFVELSTAVYVHLAGVRRSTDHHAS